MKSIDDLLQSCNIDLKEREYYICLYNTFYDNAIKLMKENVKLKEHKIPTYANRYAYKKLDNFLERYKK